MQLPQAVPNDWILLESQSTYFVFKTKLLLTNFRHCGQYGLTMYSKGGSQLTDLIGEYESLGITVWYNSQSLAIIIGMATVMDRYRVTRTNHKVLLLWYGLM